MELKNIKEANVNGMRVLIRCGFDVPFDQDGNITDDERIVQCLPLIKYLSNKGAKCILCSHNGRPKGEIVPKLSMDKIAARLEELIELSIKKINDCIGAEVKTAVDEMQSGDIVLLENLRFHKEEEQNDDDFSKQLASLADIYVNEAFANSHRNHSSMTGVMKLLPSYAGFRLVEEIKTLSGVFDNAERPLVAVIGGVKISDKINVITRFLTVADHILIGGALANNILKAKGVSVGKSIVEEKMMDVAKSLPLTDIRLHVPVDVLVANEISDKVDVQKKAAGNVGDDEYILDIGADTIKLYEMIIAQAKTVVWGGPMGYFEIKAFSKGSVKIAKSICKSSSKSIVGGGDTMKVLDLAKCEKKISFVSTGGGAMLEFLGNNSLPAIDPLIKK